MEAAALLKDYDLNNLTIGVLGGHSALDVAYGAKKHGFRTVAVAPAHRAPLFANYFKTRPDGRGCVDQVIQVGSMQDVLKPEIQNQLRKLNTIFVHNRYFWVYFSDFGKVENDFKLPIFGSRTLLKLEERNQPFNQYHFLEEAGIRIPKIYKRPEEIDRLVIVKVNEAMRSFERAFFLVDGYSNYMKIVREKIQSGEITEEGLKNAVIEEYVIGAAVNFNFFYSTLTGELELLGTDTRRQTNLDGIVRMTAMDQMSAFEHGKIQLKMIETGHIAVTVKESLLVKAFELGEKFVKQSKNLPKELDPSGKGIIGPFALQAAVVSENAKEDIVVFDVSFRIPGSPGLAATPYMGYLYGQSMSVGERVGLEIKNAVKAKRLQEILT